MNTSAAKRIRIFVIVGMLLTMSVAAFVVLPQVVSAAPGLDRLVPCDGPDCDFCALGTLAQNVLNFIIFLSVIISAIMFAYAGFLYFANAGSTERVNYAKKILTSVVVGIIIILTAWLVVDTIIKTLTGNEGEGFGPWNGVC